MFNGVDLPLSISYYRLLCKMLFRINVSIKKRETHRRSYVLFMFFVIMHMCMLQKMCNCAPWGHTFRWVAEFGVTPATFSAFSPQGSVRLSLYSYERMGKCKFSQTWVDDPTFKDWLKPLMGSDREAFCLFNVTWNGIKAIKSHNKHSPAAASCEGGAAIY